jgi:hypothetical protein
MRASMDNLRYPGAPGKLRKQAIASIGAARTAHNASPLESAWLNYITLTDFEAI